MWFSAGSRAAPDTLQRELDELLLQTGRVNFKKKMHKPEKDSPISVADWSEEDVKRSSPGSWICQHSRVSVFKFQSPNSSTVQILQISSDFTKYTSLRIGSVLSGCRGKSGGCCSLHNGTAEGTKILTACTHMDRDLFTRKKKMEGMWASLLRRREAAQPRQESYPEPPTAACRVPPTTVKSTVETMIFCVRDIDCTPISKCSPCLPRWQVLA